MKRGLIGNFNVGFPGRYYDIESGTHYTYDTMGRVRQIQYPGGTTVEYTHNQQDEVTLVRASHPSFSLRDVAANIEHKPFGPLSGLTFGSGETRTIDRDMSYRIKQIQSGSVAYHQYFYDDNDNITDLTDEFGGLDRTHGYDELDRLDSHTGPDGSFSYTYDANGNRETEVRSVFLPREYSVRARRL